jgi:hypothetical protein
MSDTEPDQPSRFERDAKRIESWVYGLRDQVERASGPALEELASLARSLAWRLDEMADKAKTKYASEEAVADPAEPDVPEDD